MNLTPRSETRLLYALTSPVALRPIDTKNKYFLFKIFLFSLREWSWTEKEKKPDFYLLSFNTKSKLPRYIKTTTEMCNATELKRVAPLLLLVASLAWSRGIKVAQASFKALLNFHDFNRTKFIHLPEENFPIFQIFFSPKYEMRDIVGSFKRKTCCCNTIRCLRGTENY